MTRVAHSTSPEVTENRTEEGNEVSSEAVNETDMDKTIADLHRRTVEVSSADI